MYSRPEMTFHWRDSVVARRPVITQEKELAPQPIRRLEEEERTLRGQALKNCVRSETLELAMIEYMTTNNSLRRVALKWRVSSATLCRHLGKLTDKERDFLIQKYQDRDDIEEMSSWS